ncbi:hypothetical protein [Streptomyces sp. NPDC000878]
MPARCPRRSHVPGRHRPLRRADTDHDPREQLAPTTHTPNASTQGRLPAPPNGDAPDDAVGARLPRHATHPADEPGDTPAGSAADGKTVRGPRTDPAAAHLPATALHTRQTMTAQHQTTAKSNETPAHAPLPHRTDPHGVVTTADATHTQHAHTEHITATGGQPRTTHRTRQESLAG